MISRLPSCVPFGRELRAERLPPSAVETRLRLVPGALLIRPVFLRFPHSAIGIRQSAFAEATADKSEITSVAFSRPTGHNTRGVISEEV